MEKFETGTTSYFDRIALSRRFEEKLEEMFSAYNLKIMPFGQGVLVKNTWIASKLRKVDSKKNLASLMVKFSPDYIVHKKNRPEALFFLDAKASITPIYFKKQIDRIKNHSGDDTLKRSHIGDIEREAWFSYKTFYPDVVIVMACPYSDKVILAEWVKNIKCLWCYKGKKNNVTIPWSCNECPINVSDDGFDVVVNEFAGGSGTPHTNIDFRSMRSLPVFLKEEFNIEIDLGLYEKSMLKYVKQWPLNKPRGSVSWTQYNGAIRRLREEGLNWLKFRYEENLYDTYEDFFKAWKRNR